MNKLKIWRVIETQEKKEGVKSNHLRCISERCTGKRVPWLDRLDHYGFLGKDSVQKVKESAGGFSN